MAYYLSNATDDLISSIDMTSLFDSAKTSSTSAKKSTAAHCDGCWQIPELHALCLNVATTLPRRQLKLPTIKAHLRHTFGYGNTIEHDVFSRRVQASSYMMPTFAASRKSVGRDSGVRLRTRRAGSTGCQLAWTSPSSATVAEAAETICQGRTVLSPLARHFAVFASTPTIDLATCRWQSRGWAVDGPGVLGFDDCPETQIED